MGTTRRVLRPGQRGRCHIAEGYEQRIIEIGERRCTIVYDAGDVNGDEMARGGDEWVSCMRGE